MSKTIKELADSLGVSKTAIRNYMDEDFRAAHTVTNRNGVITIDSAGCLLIAETMGKQWEESASTENNIPKTPESTENPLYTILRDELAAKNRQIEQLQAQLAEQTQINKELAQSINAERKNELAGTLREILPEGEPAHGEEVAIDAEPVDPPAAQPAAPAEPEQKPGFFIRLGEAWQVLIGKR